MSIKQDVLSRCLAFAASCALACQADKESEEVDDSSSQTIVDPYNCPTPQCLVVEEPVHLCSQGGSISLGDGVVPQFTYLPLSLSDRSEIVIEAGVYPLGKGHAVRGPRVQLLPRGKSTVAARELAPLDSIDAGEEVDSQLQADPFGWGGYEPGWIRRLTLPLSDAGAVSTLHIRVLREKSLTPPHFILGSADNVQRATRRTIILAENVDSTGEGRRTRRYMPCALPHLSDISLHLQFAQGLGELSLDLRRLPRELALIYPMFPLGVHLTGVLGETAFEANGYDEILMEHTHIPPAYPMIGVQIAQAGERDDGVCYLSADAYEYRSEELPTSYLVRLYDCDGNKVQEIGVERVDFTEGAFMVPQEDPWTPQEGQTARSHEMLP